MPAAAVMLDSIRTKVGPIVSSTFSQGLMSSSSAWPNKEVARLGRQLCMMPLMVKEGDLNWIEVRKDYEVLDATALGRRLGFKGTRRWRTSRGGTSGVYCVRTASLL